MAAWANKRIDDNSESIMGIIAYIAEFLGNAPLSWTIVVAIFVLLGLFVHSYFFDSPTLMSEGKLSSHTNTSVQSLPVKAAASSVIDDLFEQWDNVDTFTVSQAVCLWCEKQPVGDFEYRQIKDSRGLAAIDQMLSGAISNGSLPADSSKNGYAIIGDYSRSFVQRDDLIRFAQTKGQRPKFLFSEER